MPEEKPATEEVYLPSGGPVAGIPGHHAPGRYLIDWLKRTITPVVDEVEQLAEDIKPKKTTAPTDAPDKSDPASGGQTK